MKEKENLNVKVKTNTNKKSIKKIKNKDLINNKKSENNNNFSKEEKDLIEQNIKNILNINIKKTKKKNTKEENSQIKHNTNSVNKENKRKNFKISDKKNLNKKGILKFIPLGGFDEIGKNIAVLEYEDELIIIDCGLAFPDDDMHGIDIVIPDFDYLVKNKDKIKGLFVTHGHEDHIGSIPYLLKQINVPIFAGAFTMELIKFKLKEHKLLESAKLHTVEQGEEIKLKNFSVEFIASAHSIPDSSMFAIRTPVGTLIHTGDFKIELTPVDGKEMDLGRIAEIGNEGVLALFADSTNSERDGFTPSEKSVGKIFDQYFENSKKRIIVASFASNVNRVQQLINLAVKYDRKIAISGRSMKNVLEATRNLKYIDVPDNVFIELEEINNYPDDKLLLITTGSQGEPMSALTRIATGQHNLIKLTPNDLVIISATPIPGNEPSVAKLIDNLIKRNVEVVYSALELVHVSGHACKEEQKFIMALVKPKYFIPVHGNTRHLHKHRDTSLEMGVPKSNTFIMENGKILEFTKSENDVKASIAKEKVKTGKIFVDGLGIGDVGNVVLRDRQLLAQDGIIITILTIDSSTGALVCPADIITKGFVYAKESEEILSNIKNIINEKLNEIKTNNWNDIKNLVRNSVARFVYKETKREPMVIPIIVEGN